MRTSTAPSTLSRLMRPRISASSTADGIGDPRQRAQLNRLTDRERVDDVAHCGWQCAEPRFDHRPPARVAPPGPPPMTSHRPLGKPVVGYLLLDDVAQVQHVATGEFPQPVGRVRFQRSVQCRSTPGWPPPAGTAAADRVARTDRNPRFRARQAEPIRRRAGSTRPSRRAWRRAGELRTPTGRRADAHRRHRQSAAHRSTWPSTPRSPRAPVSVHRHRPLLPTARTHPTAAPARMNSPRPIGSPARRPPQRTAPHARRGSCRPLRHRG